MSVLFGCGIQYLCRMDAPSRPRNSRWDRAPIRGTNGLPQQARVTERDLAIFKLLGRYRYLTIDDIHEFVGGSRKGLAHHLGLLCREPNLYLRRPVQQRESADANYRPLVYELDRRARTLLFEHGFPIPASAEHHNFAHELMACHIVASFEIATIGNPGLRFIPWDLILASPKMPENTRTALRPNHIRVAFAANGKQQSTEVCADGKPFGIEYRAPAQEPTYRFFAGVEADTGTEPLQSYDIERSSIFRKFLAYLAIEEKQLHRSQFGFPNMFVPFGTTSESRMRSMMKLLAKITDGRGSRIILFKCCSPTATEAQPAHILTEPWQRVGFSPLSLDR